MIGEEDTDEDLSLSLFRWIE